MKVLDIKRLRVIVQWSDDDDDDDKHCECDRGNALRRFRLMLPVPSVALVIRHSLSMSGI